MLLQLWYRHIQVAISISRPRLWNRAIIATYTERKVTQWSGPHDWLAGPHGQHCLCSSKFSWQCYSAQLNVKAHSMAQKYVLECEKTDPEKNESLACVGMFGETTTEGTIPATWKSWSNVLSCSRVLPTTTDRLCPLTPVETGQSGSPTVKNALSSTEMNRVQSEWSAANSFSQQRSTATYFKSGCSWRSCQQCISTVHIKSASVL